MIRTILFSVLSFIRGIFNPANYTLRNITLLVIVLMCIQYIPIDGWTISPVKVAMMSFMPLVLLMHLRLNKAFLLGSAYMLWIFFTAAILHPATFRASTVLYSCVFVITYMVVYTSIWNYRVFTLNEFLQFLRIFFFVFIGVLLVQQACLAVGVREMPVINLCHFLDRGIGSNSLTLEPSHLGRILAVLYYAILKCTEYQRGKRVKVSDVFDNELKWVTIFYIWAVLTMGSGTAFVAAGVVSLYFMRGWSLLLAIPLFVGIFFLIEYLGNESFTRAQRTAIATMTGDADVVRETDGSASARIAPMLNTINHLDFSDTETWIGHGCDYGIRRDIINSDKRMIGDIGDYGFIAYLLSLCLVFCCAIRPFSLATIMYFVGVGGGTGNIAYGWGLLLVFTAIRYFHNHQNDIDTDEED